MHLGRWADSVPVLFAVGVIVYYLCRGADKIVGIAAIFSSKARNELAKSREQDLVIGQALNRDPIKMMNWQMDLLQTRITALQSGIWYVLSLVIVFGWGFISNHWQYKTFIVYLLAYPVQIWAVLVFGQARGHCIYLNGPLKAYKKWLRDPVKQQAERASRDKEVQELKLELAEAKQILIDEKKKLADAVERTDELRQESLQLRREIDQIQLNAARPRQAEIEEISKQNGKPPQ